MSVAIVTGGSSGIGSSTAVELARRGASVVLTYSSNEAGAKQTVAAVERHGGKAVALPLDVGRGDTFPAFRDQVAEVLRGWGRDSFDVLVNNAGFSSPALFPDTSEEQFDRLYRVLLKGPFFLTQTLLPLLADGGTVVNTTSSSTQIAEPGYSGYASMKGGLVVLTRYLAKELSVRGIRVNSVSPGPTRTRLGDDGFEKYPEVIPALAAKTALGRLGEPDDVAVAIAALAGADGRWITAQDIEVSGGFQL
ncbi:NAD(P)-dependent dehydrogenase, short-chain alcohol dehydrogenase family [Lentzea fradiae]|uniref:NAD(P)-dependent dehydrogenase, short-chain alcohol dehydrogenase family n=1 Tax=Lentzea fradiae TaxID=200378 RepID=A0A1G7PCI2_9PSEU|nr:SDR family oxidoreductase [Lentzea fradiae]SDF83170.1 NAD(P)-dependent dehydrogenase, short-chain alcohol dehydrogenase family [Lentzea fradiae]